MHAPACHLFAAKGRDLCTQILKPLEHAQQRLTLESVVIEADELKDV